MNRYLLTTVMAALFLVPAARADETVKSWMPLFNGENLSGWKTDPKQPGNWHVTNGLLVGEGNALSHLFSERGCFTNFQLRAEAKINARGNSGVYFRSGLGLANLRSFPRGYEAQIHLGGNGSKETQLTGSLYGFAPVQQQLIRPDTWFRLEVIADEQLITIKVDGKTAVTYRDEKETYRSGHFALQQSPGTVVAFRKIEVQVPSYQLIRQGRGPTCGFNATMAAMLHSGIDITKAITDKGNNRYEVKLYVHNDPGVGPAGGLHLVTIPIDFDGKTLFGADPVITPGNQNEIWVVIVQRAMVEAMRQWNPRQSIEHPLPPAGGRDDVMAMFSGRRPKPIWVNESDARQRVEAAIKAGKPLIYSDGGHVRAVLGATNDGLLLYDPYGHLVNLAWEKDIKRGKRFWVDDGFGRDVFNGVDLAGWKLRGDPGRNRWKVGSVATDGDGALLCDKPGNFLVNSASAGIDVYTEHQFGDCLVEIEALVPRGSNSGIYLMGRYEVQLLDGFGKQALTPKDMGAIYGIAAPTANACKQPGEWQKFVIDFIAPRFNGKTKTANAKFVKVELNGKTIHENVEMTSGATGGALGAEVPTGPLLLQGDHGPVAFRNLRITKK
jgi:hypothetical protein